MRDRHTALREALDRRFDVIVIGGGINGAGIARDAAERGLHVLLLEQHDWGFGTTWRSTKLIHGGLRYLEHGELALVFESLRERGVLLRIAPHLVRPMPFLLPLYAGNRRGPTLVGAGLTVYDLLARGGGLPRHRRLRPSAVVAIEPHLRRQGLRAAFAYWDAQVALPERLCLENVLRAHEAGAVALSYMRVRRILATGGRVTGVAAEDRVDGRTYEFRAPLVLNAAGPWVDDVLATAGLAGGRIGGTRGTHLVVRFPDGGPRRAIYAEAPQDHRPVFVIPWRGVHLVGTTDVRVDGPDDGTPSDAEIDYLLEATQTLLPGAGLGPESVWYAFAGIRPLPASPRDDAGAITRRHRIIDHAAEGRRGLYSVVGGKLSTYRNLAAHLSDRLCAALQRGRPQGRTADVPLVPGCWTPTPGNATEHRLWRIYGPNGAAVARLMRDDPSLAAPLCPHTQETVAQAVHAVRREGAITVADVLLRRTPAGWSRCLGLDAAPVVARVLAEAFGWDDATQQQACERYRAEALRTFRRLRADFCFC